MSFVFAGALAILVLVAAPVTAHLLRVRRAEQRPFPPANLVPPSPPATNQRRKLEDRALLTIRALAIVALALLGATPLIQCSRLAISRAGGGNVALVLIVDDSMSMRARDDGRVSRFSLALQDAFDLLKSTQEGDAVAIVLAGAPVRVALAPTSDLQVVQDTLDSLVPSDRATDLDGALSLSSSLLRNLPYAQKRVVLLSDRCDGQPDGQPIANGSELPVWIPARRVADKAHDCALIEARVREGRVLVRVACTGELANKERSVIVRAGEEELGRALIRDVLGGRDGVADIEVPVGGKHSEATVAELDGEDLIRENDRADIAHHLDVLTIGVLSDRALSGVETGGPPPVEQALTALQTSAIVQPIPTVPDTLEDLSRFAALVLDDPAGFTPETRDALRMWLKGGGVALVGLGPLAAHAPLGATLDPFIPGVPRWIDSAPGGAKAQDVSVLGPSGESLIKLSARGRIRFELEGLDRAQTVVRWSDEAPLIVKRHMGRGLAYLTGLPFGPAWSDLPLRPAFLALLSEVTETARLRGGAKRIEVGQSWVFDSPVQVATSMGDFPPQQRNNKVTVTPTRAGRYDVFVKGDIDRRFAIIPEREVDLRPRAAAESAQDNALGTTTASVDISRWIALLLLVLLAVELGLRAIAARQPTVRPF